MGETVVQMLASPDLAQYLQVSEVSDAASARTAVDSGQASAAVIIPTDFSVQYADPYGEAVIELYRDPASSLGTQVVQSVLEPWAESLASYKIAYRLVLDTSGYAGASGLVFKQAAGISGETGTGSAETLVAVQPVGSDKAAAAQENSTQQMVGSIMGGMMIFFAFFTGTATAQTILKEEEEGTLPRLFTTPTAQATILTGKFLAVLLTVLVQVTVLLITAHLIFGIQWGAFPSVALVTVGIVLSASSFGIFINSLLKTTKQGGIVFGGVLTMSGMIGMMPVFTGARPPELLS